MTNEWIDWTGGECPVDGVIDARHRNGMVILGLKAKHFRWDHIGYGYDITAYRLHQPKPDYGEWIKCSERMPEKEMEVIIFSSQGVGVGCFVGSSFIPYGEHGVHVTHWMPAPAEPKE